ncbi:MAG: HAD-IIA family hydrolase [Gaiellaceae bacterium]
MNVDATGERRPLAHAVAPAFDGLILDLDGVVWLGLVPVPGSVDAIAGLRESGVQIVFLTNDPRSSRADYAARLTQLGIPAESIQIVTSGSALARYVGEREGPGAHVFAIGSPMFKAELAASGLSLCEGLAARAARVVAVGGHDSFDYDELRTAAQALRRGATLYAAGRDAAFPMPDGPWPGTGSIVAAVEVAGGTRAITVGKPEPFVFDLARSALRKCHRIAVVGDSLESDIVGGKHAGLATVLVLTGTCTADDVAVSPVQPDIVLPDLAALLPKPSATPAPTKQEPCS